MIAGGAVSVLRWAVSQKQIEVLIWSQTAKKRECPMGQPRRAVAAEAKERRFDASYVVGCLAIRILS